MCNGIVIIIIITCNIQALSFLSPAILTIVIIIIRYAHSYLFAFVDGHAVPFNDCPYAVEYTPVELMVYSCGSSTTEKAALERVLLDEEPMDEDDPASAF